MLAFDYVPKKPLGDADTCVFSGSCPTARTPSKNGPCPVGSIAGRLNANEGADGAHTAAVIKAKRQAISHNKMLKRRKLDHSVLLPQF